MKLGIQEIYEAARAAGFTPDQATTWTAIALAESGGETGALNDSGEHSMGLWQINVSPTVRENVWGNLNDPVVNARAAYDISNHGLDMRPWTTTHASHEGTSTDYRTYLDDVSAVTGYAGDDRGVEGYGSPLLDPLEPSTPTMMSPASMGYDQIDLGMQADANLDTDSDGLTDAFERMSGSSPNVADTDQDGLSDAYETVISQSSTTLADSDLDQASDSAEVALGSSPTTWDTDLDGFSDSVEAEYGTDPLRAEPGTQPASAHRARRDNCGRDDQRDGQCRFDCRPDCQPDQQHRGRHEAGYLRRGCPRTEGRRLRLRGGDRSRRHQPDHVRLLGADPVGRRPGRRDDS